MKSTYLLLAGLALAAVAAADQTAVVVPGPVQVVNTTPPSPVLRWRVLHGEVRQVYPERHFLELKLDKDNDYIGVPVTRTTVGLFKHEHEYALEDLKPGDNVTVQNRALD